MIARRIALALLLVLVLTGWTACQRRGDAPVADVDPECRKVCTPSLEDTGVRWEGDPEDPAMWDRLGKDVVNALAQRLLQCEKRRRACEGFIDDLHERGTIRKGEP